MEHVHLDTTFILFSKAYSAKQRISELQCTFKMSSIHSDKCEYDELYYWARGVTFVHYYDLHVGGQPGYECGCYILNMSQRSADLVIISVLNVQCTFWTTVPLISPIVRRLNYMLNGANFQKYLSKEISLQIPKKPNMQKHPYV